MTLNWFWYISLRTLETPDRIKPEMKDPEYFLPDPGSCWTLSAVSFLGCDKLLLTFRQRMGGRAPQTQDVELLQNPLTTSEMGRLIKAALRLMLSMLTSIWTSPTQKCHDCADDLECISFLKETTFFMFLLHLVFHILYEIMIPESTGTIWG